MLAYASSGPSLYILNVYFTISFVHTKTGSFGCSYSAVVDFLFTKLSVFTLGILSVISFEFTAVINLRNDKSYSLVLSFSIYTFSKSSSSSW